MLEIFNNLAPFMNDNYKRISVREYARMQKMSPPTSSKILKGLKKEDILKSEEERRHLFFYPNRDSQLFINLERTYYSNLLYEIGLIKYLEKEMILPVIILYGSFAKGEITKESDIDLAIFTPSKKTLKLDRFEKRLKRKIQPLIFKSRNDVKNKHLLNNILNGMKVKGNW